MQLPVINISSLVGQTNENEIESVSNQIVDGLKEFGFIYISEHGISQECIKQSFDASKRLFQLDSLQKGKFSRSKTENWGYVPFRMETFEKGRPFDLKECFNYYPSERNKGLNELVPNLEDIEKKLFDDCTQLTYLLMKAINTALPTDDKNYLRKTHDIGDVSNNPSAMRLLYYPPIERQDDTVQGQLRCGEHSDYGTITLLFQDEAGGLQIVSPSGKYVELKPIPGTIVVNNADLLEIWSSGAFKSTRHRVVIPADVCSKPRQSIAFFVSPNNDVTVSNLDNSGKHEPVNAWEYLWGQYAKSY